MNDPAIERSFRDIAERIEQAQSSYDAMEYDDEVDLTTDVAVPAVLALSDLVHLLRDLREAGADLAETPVEEEALVAVVANGALVAASIKADVEHLESVIARVTS